MLEQKVSVIVPAYNESLAIAANLGAIVDALSPHAPHLEIIVVDDGSRDQTWRFAADTIVRSAAAVRILRYERNEGKGFALACGARHATGEFVVFLDADLDLHPDQVPRFFDILFATGADAVIGSKWHPQSRVEYPAWRRILSHGYYTIVRLLFGLPLRDTQTGLKMFRARLLKRVVPRLLTKRFAFDVELLAVAHRMGFKIVEAPVRLQFRRDVPRLRWHDSWHALVDTLAVFYRIHLRRYYDREPVSAPSSLVNVLEVAAPADR
ncbi:MAG TPA: glycosyltransferase [Candidatus Eremiobacteraceae bacterium]|nr:glycosyltransferase [Candidatus Eremiobacteraceae bacterium]